jgi:uncharacterized protein YcfJ
MDTVRSTSTAGVAVLSALLAAAPLVAEAARKHPVDTDDGYYAYAEVVEVSPRYGWHEITEPVQQCADVTDDAMAYAGRHEDHYGRYRDDRYAHYRYERRHGAGAAGLVGGLIGGIIGHQFGGGNGKTAMTVAGAALGASIARDRARRERDYGAAYYTPHHPEPYTYTRSVRRCTESQRTRRVRGVNGYDVVYRYQGATFHKWVDEHPGDAIRVHVAVEPLAGER